MPASRAYGAPRAQGDADSLVSGLSSFRYGGSTAVLDAVAERVSSARGNPARMKAMARALAKVLKSGAPFEVKQFACRQLAFVGGPEQAPALAGLLADDTLAHYALMALSRIPGKAADDAMLAAVKRSPGLTRQEILDALAERGDGRALPVLNLALHARSVSEVSAAAFSLAKLPDPRSAAALQAAYRHLTGASRVACGRALIVCADRNLARRDAATAWQLYALVDKSPAAPILRAATLRGMTKARPAGALSLVLQALGDEGTPRQNMAADIARQIPGAQATRAMAARLPKLSPHGQVLLLSVLGERGDRVAGGAVAKLCRAPGTSVRVAALKALGTVGDETCTGVLLAAMAMEQPEARDAARDSMIRLRAYGLPHGYVPFPPPRGRRVDLVDVELERAIVAAPPAIQAEAIAVLGLRKSDGALAVILKATESKQPAVRSAAFRVLRDLGRPVLLPILVDRMLALDPADRDEAADTVTEIARRGAGESTCTAVLLKKLKSATIPADRSTILTVLGQVGGANALDALRTCMRSDPDADVQATALTQLSNWPTDAPMDALLNMVHDASSPGLRAIALRGYLRLVGTNDQRPPAEALALYKAIAPIATGPDDRRIILAGLAKIRCHDALAFAASFSGDASVRAEAETAVVAIARSTIGAWPDETRAIVAPIASSGVDANARKAAGEMVAIRDKAGDFDLAWEVSPVYLQEGANYAKLHDTPFPPEIPSREKEVPWGLMPVCTNADQPWLLDLLALWGGEQRVAYLRTVVVSDAAQQLNMELGSDDGVKAWWNGQQVLSHNVQRGVGPGQEKVAVTARAGANTLLLKIPQNVMGWGACARFTRPDGSPAQGLRFSVPSATAAP